jgi:hypothetical protein
MGSIHSGLHAIFDDERRAVTTPEAVVKSVSARIRRRRAGTMVGVSAGTLTLAGFAAAVPIALSHLGSPAVTPGAAPATDVMPGNSLGLECGDQIPDSLANAYRSEVWVGTVTVDARSLATPSSETFVSVATVGSDFRLPVEAEYSGAILAQNGVVVGWTGAARDVELSSPDMAWFSYALSVCPAARNDATGNLASGTYAQYLIDDASAAG